MTNQAVTGLFAVTKVTTGQVIWAGIALDKTWAGKLAAEALRTKIGASWHVCPAADLPDGGAEARAVAKGFEDGVAAVNAVLNEQGKAAVLKASRPGQEDWGFAARNADAAGFAGVAKGSKEAYYRAYASAGRLRAEAIEDGEE